MTKAIPSLREIVRLLAPAFLLGTLASPAVSQRHPPPPVKPRFNAAAQPRSTRPPVTTSSTRAPASPRQSGPARTSFNRAASQGAALQSLGGKFRPAASRNPNYTLLRRSQQQSATAFVARQSRQGRGSIMIGAGGLYRQVARGAGAGYYFSPRGDFARGSRNVARNGFGPSPGARSLPPGWKSNQKYIVRALLRGNAVGIGTPVQQRARGGGFSAEMKLMRRLHARGLVNLHTQRVPVAGGQSRLLLVGFTPTQKMLSLRPKRWGSAEAPSPAPAPRMVR